MKKIGFLVPIYPPHFHFSKKLLSSFEATGLSRQADLFFVFTDESEAEQFQTYDRKLILPEHLRIFENRGIINIKKFWGLTAIQEQYDYIMVIDSETEFIRQINLHKICKKFFNQKILLGNQTLEEAHEVVSKIKHGASHLFADHPDYNKLNENLYIWFNQPAIYQSSTLKHFFEVIKLEESIKTLGRFDFDYYIYMNYLILYGGFNIVDLSITAKFGAIENTDGVITPHSDHYKKYRPLQATIETIPYFD
ncbi:MAG: hypothetical protein ACRCWR_12240, partial [Saezia sp.]